MNHPNYQPALIRAFFSSFAEGILSTQVYHNEGEETLTPQRVKQLLLEHYEKISQHFFDIMFNPLAVLHYDTAEELIAILRSPEVAPTLKSPVDLFRHVCRTPEAHDDMVAEYRRNFTSLLSGRVLSLHDYYDGFPPGYLQDAEGNQEKAVRLLTQTVVNAYYAGRSVAPSATSGDNQVYIFRLLIENMQCMLHSRPLEFSDEADLNDMFLAVCRTPENMNTMLSVMQQTVQQRISQSV